MEINIGKWAQVFRFTFALVGTLMVIALAVNQVAGIGYRYGKVAGYQEAAYDCQRQPIRAQKEDVAWVINRS